MSKLKNYGLWVSLISLVGLIFKNYLPGNYQEISTLILSLLIGAGIISNPGKGKWYRDGGKNDRL